MTDSVYSEHRSGAQGSDQWTLRWWNPLASGPTPIVEYAEAALWTWIQLFVFGRDVASGALGRQRLSGSSTRI